MPDIAHAAVSGVLFGGAAPPASVHWRNRGSVVWSPMLTTKLVRIGLFALGLCFVGAPALSHADTSLSHGDVSFLKKASQGGIYEVQVGTYAGRNGGCYGVRSLGRMMAKDHAALNAKVGAWAQSQGVTLSTDPSLVTEAKIKLATQSTGKDFDASVVPTVIKAHQDDIAAFEKEAGETKNPELKALVEDALPTLRHHLHMAQDVKAKLDTK